MPRESGAVVALRVLCLGACLAGWAACAPTAWADELPSQDQVDPASSGASRPSLHCASPTFCCPGPPVYGYDSGFYVRDARARFSLRPSAFTQLRWTRNERSSAPPDGDARVEDDVEFARTRVRLEGDLTDRFYYDVRFNVNSSGEATLIVSYLQWNINDEWALQFGTLPLADQREDWARPLDLLTTEYSANDLIFAPGFTGFGSGLQVVWEGDVQRAWGAISDGEFFGGNHLVEETGTADWAVTGRYEHQFCTRDWSIWDDLVGRRGREFGVLLGVMGGVTRGGSRVDVDMRYLLTADVSVNWDGGQAMVFGNFLHTEQNDGTSESIWGLAAQAGHFVTNTVQPYARYEVIAPGSTSGEDLTTYESLTAGLNYYPFRWTNLYKASLEFSYLFTPLDRTIVPADGGIGFQPSSEDQWYLRLQLQFGF